ncbi:MAG: hypothetical protein Q8844_02670 [Pigeon pea little leaf phytoplasma]|nr:hypothetical protein [Pigeon pea little leaf phytoplasma]
MIWFISSINNNLPKDTILEMKLILLYLMTLMCAMSGSWGEVDDNDDEDGGNELAFDDDLTLN